MQFSDDSDLAGTILSAPIGICMLNAATLVSEMVNDKFLEVAGKPYEAIQGQFFWDSFPETRSYYEQALATVVQTGTPYYADEVELVLTRHGMAERVFITFVYMPVKNAQGETTKIAVWVLENTQQVKSRQAISNLNERLAVSNEEQMAINEELTSVNEELVSSVEELSDAQQELQLLNKELTVRTAQLAESESKFRNMIQASPVALLVTRGEDMIFEEFNQAMLDMVGKDITIKGKPWFEAIPELKGQAVLKDLYHTYHTGAELQLEEVPITMNRNGEPYPGYYSINYKPLIKNGLITGVLQSVVDVTLEVNARREVEQLNEELTAVNEELVSTNGDLITARQIAETAIEEQAAANEELTAMNRELIQLRYDAEQAEQTLRVAIDAADFGTWYIHAVTRHLIANNRLKELFGFAADEEPTLTDYTDQITKDYRTYVITAFNQVIAQGGNYDLTYTVRGKHNDIFRWVRAIGSLKADVNGELTAFNGVVLDITEQKADEQRKNDFIGMVSHELKTPLTTIGGYLQILKSRTRKAEDHLSVSMFEKTGQQVNKMTTMINGFLNVSRLESGKIHIDLKRFDLALLVKETGEETHATISSHRVEFAPVEETIIDADRDKIGQVIGNLLSNAVKYSPAGSTIDVACVTEGHHAFISVKDEGRGISAEDLPRLFERYYRVKEVQDTTTIAGFGIGLYLCHEIIKRHEGNIWAESELGKGSTFYFMLPVAG